MTDEQLTEGIPDFIQSCPIVCDWVTYKGQVKFAILNFEESEKRGKAMIDLCYCATKGLINGIVERTVPYSEKNFKIKTWDV